MSRVLSPQAVRTLSLAIALALPASAWAQAAPGGASATDLDEVVVTATRTATPLAATIAPSQVIGRAEIERSQASSLPQLLGGRAGINLTNSGGAGKQTSLFLRGTNSSHTLVLLDGVRINSPDFSFAPLQDLPLAQIDRIEIVRGPASSLYGSEAIGGVIQIFTRKGAAGTPGEFAPHFQLGTGSHGLREASAGFGGAGERGWFGTDLAHERTDGINACRGSATLFAGCFADEPDRDGYRNLSLSLRGGYTLTDTLQVEASALRVEAENEYDGSWYNYSETVQQVLNSKLRYTPSERLALTLNIGRNDSLADNYQGDFLAGVNDSHRDTASFQADVTLASGHLLSAGADWYEDRLDSSTAYVVASRDNTAVFAQYQGTFGVQQLQASLRSDDNEQFGRHTTGTLGWGMALGDELRVSARYGTGFKAPTFSDLYDPWSGVPTLRPEESESLNIGLSQDTGRWNWTLDLYETRIDDLITYDASTWMMAQVEQARIRGAEFTFNTAFAGWDVSTQFSHTNPRNDSAGGAQFDNLLARRARNTARMDLDRRFGAFRVGTTLAAAGERYDDAANQVRLAGYGTVDLRLEYALNPSWSVQARATNVFDREYETMAWYHQPGREYGLRLKYQPTR